MKNQSNTSKEEKDLAQTPEWFISSVLNLLGLPSFDLDVCALKATAKANYWYSLAERGDNSLILPWHTWNWCNPPFSSIAPWVEKAKDEAELGKNTAMIMPNNPEVEYIRKAKTYADTIIEMPFRLKFLRPDGRKFLDKKGKEQSPQFSCLVAVFTPLGLRREVAHMYYDFREGFYER